MDNKEELKKFTKQLFSDFKEILFNQQENDPCDFCLYQIKDCSEKCKYYQQGVGVTDEKGKYLDWKWTCQDWVFGTCERLENTPCHNCWTKDYNFVNWKYKNIC